MRRFSCFLLIILTVFSFTFARGAEYYEAPNQIVLTFTGDCTLGCTPTERLRNSSIEKYVEKYGLEYLFALVKDVFEQDDLTIINLETTFYDSEKGKADKTYPFRGPVEYAKMLPLSSVEVAYLGNNHSLDYDVYGFESTVKALEENGVDWFGSTECSNKTFIYEKNGIKIGFVSINISYWWATGVGTQMKQTVADLKEKYGCTVVIACIHGGVEYDTRHEKNQEKMADAFIRYGADIVVGNHPHVIQGMRTENGVTTLWSLGNFSFGGNSKIKTPGALYAYMARFILSFDEDGNYLGHQLNILPVLVSGNSENNDYQPRLATGKDAEKVMSMIKYDTKQLKAEPYVEGIGALQNFVPAGK